MLSLHTGYDTAYLTDAVGRGEAASDYYTGDPGHPVLRWSVRDPRRRDFWRHAVIPSWYTEATAVLDLDGQLRPLSPEKQTAEVTVGADGFTG